MKKRVIYYGAILVVILLAFGVRFYAANRLNVDHDEPVYLRDAIAYAQYMRTGQFKMLAWYERTYEHPALFKILYGVSLLTQRPIDKLPDEDLPRLTPIRQAEARDWNMTGRYVSVFLASLAVAVLAFVNPLAGFFLAVNTLSVKYTSQVYLEALPLLTSLLSALTYLRWFANIRKDPGAINRQASWLVLSAIFLGMTAASKYVYCMVGIAIVLHLVIAFLQKQIPPRVLGWLIGWGLLSILMFFVFNPYLWPHPVNRFVKTLTFHADFQNSNIVRLYGYPLWQPILWLLNPSRFYNPAPKSAFIVDIDTWIFILALVGLPRLFQQKRLFFYWLLVGLSFLLAWTTKWPQYTLVILVPFAVAASEGVTTIWNLIVKFIIPKRGAPQLNQSEKETHGYQNR